MDEWILRWLERTAPLLVGQAPRAAAELLGCAVARAPADSPQHDSLLCLFAEALYRVGDTAEAERVAQRGSRRHRPIPTSWSTCTGPWPSAGPWPAGSRNPWPR